VRELRLRQGELADRGLGAGGLERIQPIEPIRSDLLHLHASSASVIGCKRPRVDSPAKPFFSPARATTIGPGRRSEFGAPPPLARLWSADLSAPLDSVHPWARSGRSCRVASAVSSSRGGLDGVPAAAPGGRSRMGAGGGRAPPEPS